MTIDEKRMERDRELNVARQNNAEAYEQAKKPTALVQKLVDALRAVIEVGVQKTEGVYSPKNNKCLHDRYGYEGCEDCASEYLQPFLTEANAWLRQQGKRAEGAV